MTAEARVGEPELVIVPQLDDIASEAAQRIVTAMAGAVEARGRADWATTGGSLAPPIYRRLADAPLRDLVPWGDIHVWWGDDRYVPRDHPLSNVKPFDDIMLAIAWTQGGQVALGMSGQALPVGLHIENLHPFQTTIAIGAAHDAAWCASQLAQELGAAGLEEANGWPVFDLIIVGVGPDGHLLSVFPGSEAFASKEVALAIPAPTHIEPHVERVTLNPAVLAAARQIVVVAGGAAKAAVIGDILRGDLDPHRLPAQAARGENAVWILDEGAAGNLDTATGGRDDQRR